jgi:hypothetical protein
MVTFREVTPEKVERFPDDKAAGYGGKARKSTLRGKYRVGGQGDSAQHSHRCYYVWMIWNSFIQWQCERAILSATRQKRVSTFNERCGCSLMAATERVGWARTCHGGLAYLAGQYCDTEKPCKSERVLS